MNILYLYSELVGYQIPVFETYVKSYNAHVHVINWDKNRLKPYLAPYINGITYYERSKYSTKALVSLVNEINPSIAYIVAWQDKGYLSIAKILRKKGIPVVAGFDDQWKGSFKQQIAKYLGPCVLKYFFSHAWVAGPYQYEYARKLGFKKHEIIFNLLSGNTALFNGGEKHLEEKKTEFPHKFLYVGNFRSVKGTAILADAFRRYKTQYNGDWGLICIGNGELKQLLEEVAGIEVIDFTDQDGLLKITKRAGVFVLPSIFDQWGVVVHEFASAGMPLILSENVGARAMFLVEGFNGVRFGGNSPDNLARAMHYMAKKSNAELIQMGRNSCVLSKRISPEIAASSFMSILGGNTFSNGIKE
jgi:glycosyltransferase involved in cell wall biosynthesis